MIIIGHQNLKLQLLKYEIIWESIPWSVTLILSTNEDFNKTPHEDMKI